MEFRSFLHVHATVMKQAKKKPHCPCLLILPGHIPGDSETNFRPGDLQYYETCKPLFKRHPWTVLSTRSSRRVASRNISQAMQPWEPLSQFGKVFYLPLVLICDCQVVLTLLYFKLEIQNKTKQDLVTPFLLAQYHVQR